MKNLAALLPVAYERCTLALAASLALLSSHSAIAGGPAFSGIFVSVKNPPVVGYSGEYDTNEILFFSPAFNFPPGGRAR